MWEKKMKNQCSMLLMFGSISLTWREVLGEVVLHSWKRNPNLIVQVKGIIEMNKYLMVWKGKLVSKINRSGW